MIKLRLKAVDSRYATPDELKEAGIAEHQIPKTSDGKMWNIASHQAATVKALRHGTAPIIINCAMTGDGKTLAGRFQLLTEKWRSFAMYPTNELAYDQVQGFDELMSEWVPPAWGKAPQKRLINAQEIDNFSFGDDSSSTRSEELQSMLFRQDYILTNPDIFHLIMSFAYQQQGTALDFMPAVVAPRFPLYIFDEFHLFGVEQIASVMISMLLIRQIMNNTHTPPRFLFLSATPQKLLTLLAGKMGLEVQQIDGSYEHGRIQPSPNYRRILQEADLYLYSGRLEEWVKEHFESVIKPFFMSQHSTAKGLIIANSVATAHRVYIYLMPLCESIGLKLGINTGITPKQDRSRDFDLLVATSTVDVGVDFKINFLVFESRDAASHQQRLGRLGRHEKNTAGEPFPAFEAHALLPEWTLEGIKARFPEHEQSISREEYKITLEEHFASLQQFDKYISRWAGVQAGKVLHALDNHYIRKQYQESSKELQNAYLALFHKSVKKYQILYKEKQYLIIDAASSFRGGSPFTALIQDPETHSQHIMSYNLMALLRQADLISVPLDEMLQQAKKRGQNSQALKKTKPLAAYRLLGWREEIRPIEFEIDSELNEEQFECVIQQNRFRLVCVGIPELQALNHQLYNEILVALFIRNKDPLLLRRLLRLGFQIELFPFRTLDNVTGTVAFGRDALLIDSILIRDKDQSSNPIII